MKNSWNGSVSFLGKKVPRTIKIPTHMIQITNRYLVKNARFLSKYQSISRKKRLQRKLPYLGIQIYYPYLCTYDPSESNLESKVEWVESISNDSLGVSRVENVRLTLNTIKECLICYVKSLFLCTHFKRVSKSVKCDC